MKYLHYVIGDIVTILALSLITNLNAATCTTTAPGVWDCGIPTGADTLIVNHDVTITSNFILTGSIIVNSGTLTFERSFTTSGTSTVVVNNGGNIIAQSNFNTRDNSEVTISGTVTVTPGNMKMFITSKVTVTGTGILNIDGSLTIGSGADTSTFIVDNGGAVTVGKGFFMDAASTGTIDGTLAVSEDFQLDGTICGTGTITYAPEAGSPKDGCSGSGTACGDSGWCDGSGIINLGALPIELLWFKAKQNGTVVELSWLTTSESNNDFFTIEKLIDLETIKVVSTIKVFENSHKSVVYSAIDLLPQTGVNYYRLK